MRVTTPPLVLTFGVTPLSWIADAVGAVIPPVTGDAPLYREQERRISEFLKDTMKYPMVMSGALCALKARDR